MKQTFKFFNLLLILMAIGLSGFSQTVTAPTEGDQYFYWPSERAQGFSGRYDLTIELFSKNGNQLVQTMNIPNWTKNHLYVPEGFIYRNHNCKLTVRSKTQQGNVISVNDAISTEIGDDYGWAVVGQWHCNSTWSTIQLHHQIGTNYTFHLEVSDIQKVVYMTNTEKNNFVSTLPSYFVEGVHYWISELNVSIGDEYCDRNGYELSGTIYAVRRKSSVGSWIGSPFAQGVSLIDQNSGFMATMVSNQGGPALGACADHSCFSTEIDVPDEDPFDWAVDSEEQWDAIKDCLGHPDDDTGWPCQNDDDNGSILDGFGDFPIESSLQIFSHSYFDGTNLQNAVEEIAIYNLNEGNQLGQKYVYNLASLDMFSRDMETVLTTTGLRRGIYKLVITAKNGRQLQKTFVKTTGQNTGQKTSNLVDESPQFQVYPNPGSGDFQLRGLNVGSTKLNIAVVDMMGKTVYQHQQDGLTLLKIDLTDLPAGIYHVAIKGQGIGWSQKLIFQ